MVKVCVIQADNRPSLYYLLETQKINKIFCDHLKYDYIFIKMDDSKYDNLHPATKKIHIINDFLQTTTYDVLVFLDSDAWIQNGNLLNTLINKLIENNKQGCFSRDPYLQKNTFINSGSFILKINDFTREMYKTIINDLNNNCEYHKKFPYDQYYISNYVFENKDIFYIFVPDILNTPIGKVLRHNWLKNQKMHDDLNAIIISKNKYLNNKNTFNIEQYYDKGYFPNTFTNNYLYDK
jgi:hypothetical protein